jgi:hypothetical protein
MCVRRTPERRQQVEFRLELCDASELDSQFSLRSGKALLHGPERPGG